MLTEYKVGPYVCISSSTPTRTHVINNQRNHKNKERRRILQILTFDHGSILGLDFEVTAGSLERRLNNYLL